MRYLLPFLALACLLPGPAPADTIGVPADQPSVSAALATALPGDTVQVSAGTWSAATSGESFPLLVPDGVTLVGAGWEQTVLDAAGAARVIQLDGPGSARVSGFTVRGGSAERGGGIHITAGTHEVDSLLVTDCRALLRGSAINVEGAASPNVHHNILFECVDLDLDDPGDPHVAQWGGTATGTFAHNLVARGDSNGLFVFESAGPVVRHNIFFDNGIDGVRGRGMCFAGDPSTVIAYNLFWENSISALVMRNAQGDFENVDAATANAIDPADGVYGNIDGDPLLVDPDNGDFSLQLASAAIDAGEPGTGLDPDGTPLDLGPIFHPQGVSAAPAAPRARLARLDGPRPNPFNPRTTLLLELAAPARARITIHDARGRHVRTLLVGDRQAGTHPVTFDGLDDDGRALASGVYFARLDALGDVATAAMVLVR